MSEIIISPVLDVTQHPALRGATNDATNNGVTGVNYGSKANGFLGGTDPQFKQHTGVYGESDQQGVLGHSNSDTGTGVFGNSTGKGFGIRGECTDGVAIQGVSFGNGMGIVGKGKTAGRFEGNVEITGELTVQGVTLSSLIQQIQNLSKPGNAGSSTVPFNGNLIFPDGVAITSSYKIGLTSTGDVSAFVHAHCSSEVVTYDYGVVIVLVTPGGLTLAVAHSGHVSNPVIGSANDDNWQQNKTEDIVKNNWADFSQAKIVHIGMSSDIKIVNQSLNDLITQGLQAIGQLAFDLLVS